jgi:hypothetical protein
MIRRWHQHLPVNEKSLETDNFLYLDTVCTCVVSEVHPIIFGFSTFI